ERQRELETLRDENERTARELADVRQRLNVVLSAGESQKQQAERLAQDNQAMMKSLAEYRRQAEQAAAENAELKRLAQPLDADDASRRVQELESALRGAEQDREEALRKLTALTREHEMLRKRYDVFATALKNRR